MSNFNDMQRCSCCDELRNVESMSCIGGEWVCKACAESAPYDRAVETFMAKLHTADEGFE